jgi:hypothetical protein
MSFNLKGLFIVERMRPCGAQKTLDWRGQSNACRLLASVRDYKQVRIESLAARP